MSAREIFKYYCKRCHTVYTYGQPHQEDSGLWGLCNACGGAEEFVHEHAILLKQLELFNEAK